MGPRGLDAGAVAGLHGLDNLIGGGR
jgi:hypothetical protein